MEGGRVHTIEGNRSDRVARYSYPINHSQIYGYAKPNYATSVNNTQVQYPLIKKGSKNEYVRLAQQKLIKKGCSCGRWGADGIFGNDTYDAVLKFQKKVFTDKREWDGIIGTKTWAKLLA